MAALGPPGIAVGAVGLAGYGAYKYSKKKKGGGLTISRALQSPQKQKKKTKKQLKGMAAQDDNFKVKIEKMLELSHASGNIKYKKYSFIKNRAS